MDKLDNIPNTSNMLNCDVTIQCKDDTYASVLRADEEMALLMSRGFSVHINVSGIVQAGLVKAVKRFCNTAIENNGDLIMVCDVNHPDLMTVLKMTEARIRMAIIVNDEYMQALADGTNYCIDGNEIDMDALGHLMSRCSILFGNVTYLPYSCREIVYVSLTDFVVDSVDSKSFDFVSFKQVCDNYRTSKIARLSEASRELAAMAQATSGVDADLLKCISENTLNDLPCYIIANDFDSLLQNLGLQPDADEAIEMMNQIRKECNYILELAPVAKIGRNVEHKNLCLKVWRNKCDVLSLNRDRQGKSSQHYMADEEHILKRPLVLEADVVRFQNKKDKWIAFIGLIDGRPYEIFTGIADDEEGIFCPKSVNSGKIIKAVDENGQKRYDFQFINKRGFKTTIEGLSEKFNPEYWNYAKLISGVLRYGMPIEQVVKLVSSLELDLSINNWKSGVVKALKKYLPNSETEA